MYTMYDDTYNIYIYNNKINTIHKIHNIYIYVPISQSSYSQNHIITSPTFGYTRVTTGSPKTHSFWSHPLPWQSALGIFLDGIDGGFCMSVQNSSSGPHIWTTWMFMILDIICVHCTINIRYKLIHVQGVLHFLRSLCDSFHIEASRNIKPERERSQDKRTPSAAEKLTRWKLLWT